MSNTIWTEYRPELGLTFIIVFSFISLVGLVGSIAGPEPQGIFNILQDTIQFLGSWVYWLAILGPLGLAASLWWDLDYIFKARKLRGLIDTGSKAKFLKNIDDIDYLAWRLPMKYKKVVMEKKLELRIKK